MKWITPLIIAVARMAVVIASMVQRTGHAYQDVTLVFVTQISGRISRLRLHALHTLI